MKLKILSWHVRGVNDLENHKVIRNFIRTQRVDLVCVEYIKGQHLYRILIPPAHVLLSFCVRIGAFDRFRVFVPVQVFRVSCTLFVGVRVQRTNVDHCS